MQWISTLALTSYGGGCLWAAPRCLQSQHSTDPPVQSPALPAPWPCSISRGLGMEQPQCPPPQWSPPSAPIETDSQVAVSFVIYFNITFFIWVVLEKTLLVQHVSKDTCPYSGAATVVEAVHLLCQFVQLKGANAQDLDPEVVWVLWCRNINLKMFIRLEAQVRAGDWTTQRKIEYDIVSYDCV